MLLCNWINLLQKVVERNIDTTVMTFIVCIILYLIKISPCLAFIFLGVSTDWASTVIEIVFYLFEFGQSTRYQIDVLNINIIHNQASIRSPASIGAVVSGVKTFIAPGN